MSLPIIAGHRPLIVSPECATEAAPVKQVLVQPLEMTLAVSGGPGGPSGGAGASGSELRGVLFSTARLLGLLPREALPWRLHSAAVYLLAVAVSAYCLWLALSVGSNAVMLVLLVTFALAEMILFAGLGLGTALRKWRLLLPPLDALPAPGGVVPLDVLFLAVAALVIVARLGLVLHVRSTYVPLSLAVMFSLLVVVVESALFFAALRRVQTAFRSVNSAMAEVAAEIRGRVDEGREDLSGRIIAIRARHMAIVQLLSDTARCFEIQLASMLLYDFAVTVATVFLFLLFVMDWQNSLGYLTCGTLLGAVFASTHVVATVSYAELTSSEGRRIFNIAGEAYNSTQATRLEKEELNSVATFTRLHDPCISILRLFSLGADIVLPIAQCVATFIVILVQFKVAYPSGSLTVFIDRLATRNSST